MSFKRNKTNKQKNKFRNVQINVKVRVTTAVSERVLYDFWLDKR